MIFYFFNLGSQEDSERLIRKCYHRPLLPPVTLLFIFSKNAPIQHEHACGYVKFLCIIFSDFRGYVKVARTTTKYKLTVYVLINCMSSKVVFVNHLQVLPCKKIIDIRVERQK